MLFQRNIEYIRNFHVSTSSSGQNNPIAYGPGSIINGSLMITLDKPLSAYDIRVVFKCEEQDNARKTTTIFSVESVIWGKSREAGGEAQELSNGSHMYLFAIRLPQVNYPPSMHDSHFGHRIGYTLQGILETASSHTPHYTALMPVLYLPLVTCNTNSIHQASKKTQVFEKEDKKIEVTAELIKPAYCPGDLCTVKMTTNNKSDTKINSVQVSLIATATTLPPSTNSHLHKQHTLLSESFFVSVPKQARDHQDIFRLHIPSNIVPTFTNTLGKYIDISYQVNIRVGGTSTCGGGGGWFTTGNHVSNTISLPITIATVPPAYPIGISIQEQGNELPGFIPNVESPLPSPVNYPADSRAYSVSPSNSFEVRGGGDELEDDYFSLNNSTSMQQDASGHLMVPENASRRKSSSSASSSNMSELSETATLASNNRTRVETAVTH